MISQTSIFIKSGNESLYNLSIFKKYSKFVHLYRTTKNSGNNSNSLPDRSEIDQITKVLTQNSENRFRIHVLIVDQHYAENKELSDALEKNLSNHQFRTCLLVTPEHLTDIFKESEKSAQNLNGNE